MSKVELRLDWVGHDAAKFAVEHWHYSRVLPSGKNAYIGVWENGQFIGVVIFGTGASSSLGKPYGLEWNECSELVRVALSDHIAPVSRIIAIAIRMFKKKSINIRLIVSFADPFHDHVGGIYQAGNWIYCGETSSTGMLSVNGKLFHPRSFSSSAWWGGKKEAPKNAVKVQVPGKHRYLYPLDDDMRRQIEPLRKPYPKREPANEATE